MQTVRDVESKIKDDGWYEVKEKGVEDGVRRYKHAEKTGHVDIEGDPDDCVSAGWANSVYRRAQII
jgi:predicted RNA binding protein YcfA (HicA-like mRNA interferase family)